MSKLISKNNSRTNITNTGIKSQPKIINYHEIISLKKLLKSEVREVKGKEYTDAYIRLLEKKYEKIIDNSLNNNELINSLKNNQIFQKVLEKNKNRNKVMMRNHSQNIISSTNKTIAGSKILNYSNNYSNKYSPIKTNDTKNLKKTKSNINNSNPCYKSSYWEDYDFLKKNNKKEKKKIIKKVSDKEENINIEIEEKKSLENKSLDKKENSKSINNKIINNKNLENYYLYLLNKRKKNNDNITNDEKKNDKNNIEIMLKILNHIYNDEDLLKKHLEDKKIPDFYKRLIIQDEIKKGKLLDKIFLLDYKESKKMKGPELSNGSRLICKNIINYQPIERRLNIIIDNKRKNIEEIKKDVESNEVGSKSKISRTKKNSRKKTEEWLINMEKWNKNKILKIKQKREEIEKNNNYYSECIFRPVINKNAHIKKEDEGIIFSDRLYFNYFTLRQKKENMMEKQQNYFTFRPNVNKNTKYE